MSPLRHRLLPWILVLAVCLLGASSAAAITWVRVDDADLVRQSVLIVEATAGDTEPAFGSRIPSTLQTMRVQRVVHGDWSGDQLTVRWRGGLTPEGDFLRIRGNEPLALGARTLLFLGPGDGTGYDVLHLAQGLFRVAEHEGETYAYRALGGTQMSPDGKILSIAGDRVIGEIERSRHLDSFVRWIRGTATGAAPTADYWRDVSVDVLREAAAGQYLEKYTLFDSPFRWREFDSNSTITMRAHQAGQPGLAGGGFDEFRAALNAWNSDPGSNVLYRYGGQTTATGGFNGSDGVNTILFDDLEGAGDFDEEFRCGRGGTIAVGGGYISSRFTHQHRGQVFRNTLEADIITNKGADCILQIASTAREVFGHELGHTLGLGHSCGGDSGSCSGSPLLDDALMRATAHTDGRGARLNADDRAGINFLYPAVAAVPPDAPTGLSASLGVDGVVDLSWSDNASNENRFSIERRTDNLAGTFLEIATVGRNRSSFEDSLPPTGSTVSYRVRAFNGAGSSNYTNIATVATLGPPPPSALEALPVSSHSIILGWTDNTDDETAFEIQFRRQPGDFEFGLVAETGADESLATFDELFAESAFEFRVRAVTEDGASSWSEPATGTTPPFELGPCTPGPGTLCLNQGRFQNRVMWRKTDGEAGFGRKVGYDGTTDSGLFYFFGPQNWEILIKNLAGCGINDNYWVFSAATTDVEYTVQVVDTFTGETASYFNPSGSAAPAVVDVDAFVGACSVLAPAWAPSPAPTSSSAAHVVPAKMENCLENGESLLLNEGRFEVEVDWRKFDGETGTGKSVNFCTDDSGLFWFFGQDNWELLIKVLDACDLNQHYWVFSAATTNVEYELMVTDTETGATWSYLNGLGETSVAVTDTEAFPTCD